MPQINIGTDHVSLKLSAQETEIWAHYREDGVWPCSKAAGREVFVLFDRNGLVDQAFSKPMKYYWEEALESEETAVGLNTEPADQELPAELLEKVGEIPADEMATLIEQHRMKLYLAKEMEEMMDEIPSHELNALVVDHLKDVLPQDHPCWFVVVGQFLEMEKPA